jgi:SAM-dependent methyltransferase
VCDETKDPKAAAVEVAGRYDRDLLRRLPLSFRWADHQKTGLRYIMDFSVLVQALDCRVGDLVLDYAAGSGWVTEWLNRLGFKVVSLEISEDLLQVGRERLSCDTRAETQFPVHFVAGDCEHLPFEDGVFDGVVCVNSLHHMPDYPRALTEIHRVLKSGRKAAFSEPGTRHTVSPEAKREMEQYRVLERDLDIREIGRLAERVGFTDVELKPFIYTEHLRYDRKGWEGFLRKDDRIIRDYIERLVDFLVGVHTVFTLRKGDERPPDSRIPEDLRAAIRLKGDPRRVRAGQLVSFRARVRNIGRNLWLSERTPYGGFVTFGVRLYTEDGKLVTDGLGRQGLAGNVAPGEEVDVRVEFRAMLPPGKYRVECDMVDEQITWFADGRNEWIFRWR